MSENALVIDELHGAIVGPVSMTVEAGTCAAIGGPSGSGKSLLLRMIADLDPNRGDVRLGALRRDAVAAPDWRRQVMYVPAETGWWAADAQAHLPPGTMDDAATIARRLGLSTDHVQRPIGLLSTGERQRLALVRALVRRPQVLLLDEPSSALDPAGVAALEAVLRDAMADGLVLVLVSHDEAQARRLGTRRYAMGAGRLGPA